MIKDSLPYRAARRLYHFRQTDTWRRWRQALRNDRGLIDAGSTRLQLGSGGNSLPGWLNADFYPDDPSQVHIDATKRFPLPSDRFELIYCEHMIEHLPLTGAGNMLAECFRVLRPGGTLRVSTPDLEALIRIYQEPHRGYLDYHFREWLPDAPVKTPAVVFNDFARNWGHLLIYDRATLVGMLEQAGFVDIRSMGLNYSDIPDLRGLAHDHRMPDGLLDATTMTFEGVKPLLR